MINKEVVVTLEELATAMLPKKDVALIKEGEIREIVKKMAPIANLKYPQVVIEEQDIEEAIINLEERFEITMERGTILKEDNYKKWYYASKAERGTAYWDRYYRYLQSDVKLPADVISNIDASSDEIMDVLGDPLSETEFQRKGLVIGSVQSGKTSNYTALINKAADSGYKVIILLTGTIEKLRVQTQGRIDEGFVGVDSRDFIDLKKDKKNSLSIGAGKYNNDVRVASFTTTARDFNVKDLNMSLASVTDPVIFVIKKNKSILEKLYDWLKVKNANVGSGTIDLPMLLIDDESDNASINTNNPDKDPTAINNGIRKLMNLFTKYSYVGFTATPFANIFIDPRDDDSSKDSLFPKDFIYLLEQPSNYVGPTDMYSEKGRYHYMLRYNDDMGDVLDLKHKNGAIPSRLPRSLKNAINLFLIANAVRDLRGQEKQHRSMLIHVSRFISVQNIIREMVKKYFDDAKEQIKNYALSEEEVPFMKDLRLLFENEYGSKSIVSYGNDEYEKVHIKETWEDIKKALYKAVSPIQIHTVNTGSAAQRLNYEEYEDGLRLIAIGGLSLARGLTLEGLTISYFYRNTKMYDTLMQMGRWFGYRHRYEDLCRLWTSEESAGWYEHISEATEELRREVKRMSKENKRPNEFGLRVRSAEETPLIVTARNKMKHTEQRSLQRQLNGQVIETAIVPSRIEDIQANNEILKKWLIHNKEYLVKDNSVLGKNKPTFKNVPKDSVVQLLQLLDYPYVNAIYRGSPVLSEISKSTSKLLDKWDVVVASNNANNNEQPIIFGNVEIYPISRSFDFFSTNRYIRLSGSKKRLGSPNDGLYGLDKKTHDLIETSVKESLKGQFTKKGNQKSATGNDYFNTGYVRNPLLVINPVRLKKSKNEHKEINDFVENFDDLVTGISVGIPDIKGKQSITYDYIINKVYIMELIEGTSNENDWNEDYDEDDDIN